VIEEADPAFSKADWMRITAFACSARMAPALFFVRDVRGGEYSRQACVFTLSISAAVNIGGVMIR
jgi:hypothetical protein